MAPLRRTATRPISDSPWFWFCLFATFGVMMLVSFSSKIDHRQLQIEREYQARQNAGQTSSQPGESHPLATTGRIISMNPLLFVLCLVVVLAWCLLWLQRSALWTKGDPLLKSSEAGRPADHSFNEGE